MGSAFGGVGEDGGEVDGAMFLRRWGGDGRGKFVDPVVGGRVHLGPSADPELGVLAGAGIHETADTVADNAAIHPQVSGPLKAGHPSRRDLVHVVGQGEEHLAVSGRLSR